MPGVLFDVIEATEWYVPAFFEVMSYGIVTEPPAAGGVVWRRNSEPLAGAVAMFAPLEPSRFSAPQLTPESGSPDPALPRPGPSPGNVPFGPYEYVIASLAGPVVVPFWIWIQTSNECVVALPKFFTPSQS